MDNRTCMEKAGDRIGELEIENQMNKEAYQEFMTICDSLRVQLHKAKAQNHRRNMLVKDLREQLKPLESAEGYRIKNSYIPVKGLLGKLTQGGCKLYDLEDRVYDAIKAVIEYRVKQYKENYWKEALPATLFSILEGYDKDAVKVAVNAVTEALNR